MYSEFHEVIRLAGRLSNAANSIYPVQHSLWTPGSVILTGFLFSGQLIQENRIDVTRYRPYRPYCPDS